jgi:hypothetical protein
MIDGEGELQNKRKARKMMSRLHIVLFAMLGALGTGQSAAAPVTSPKAELPAIDAAAPAKIETATFALG